MSEQDCHICERGWEMVSYVSLIGWLNCKPVAFIAMAGDRPAVMLFSLLFMSVMHGLAWVSYLRCCFLYENGVDGQTGQMGCGGHIPGALHLSLP